MGDHFFFDDFEDGDLGDAEPAFWRRGGWAGASEQVIDGDLHISGSRGLSILAARDPNNAQWLSLDDSVFRTRFRILEPANEGFTSIGVIVRSGTNRAYVGGIRHPVQLVVLDGGNEIRIIESAETELDPVATDVLLELELNGDEINLTAWSEKQPRPSEPQISVVDNTLSSGTFGPYITSQSGLPVDGAFRWFQAADIGTPPPPPELRAGDADQNSEFNQQDLVLVMVAGKYLTGEPATWGEGDWNGAPGGQPGNPPLGNGLFDHLDIVEALADATYLTGPHAAIAKGGAAGDSQTSIVYEEATGKLSIDAPAGNELTSINVTSAGGKFLGSKPGVLDGAFDNFAPDNLFKVTFGGSFGSINFGTILPAGIPEDDLASDLTVVGSLAGGGDLGDVDLVYMAVPEPSTLITTLIAVGLLGNISRGYGRRN